VATAPGRAGIAILRVSGREAVHALQRLRGHGGAGPQPRRATLCRFRDGAGGVIDEGLFLWFPRHNSFTGEDVVELHVHGGRAVVSAMLDELSRMPGLRPAEPGEFTRRAFENGRLDLTAVEGLADLVAADTPAQRRQALRQLSGRLAGVYDDWTGRLTRALAWLEAEIDFADEDLPDGIGAATRTAVAAVRTEMAAHLADGRRGEIVRDGFSIAIVGPPNAGKSSLLNALAQRDAAIVAETAGTTRDVVEVRLDIGGYAAVVADTAGLRSGADPVEEEGIRRALARASQADLVLVLVDATDPGAAAGIRDRLRDAGVADMMVCANKVDLVALEGKSAIDDHAAHPLSVRTGAGMAELLAALAHRIADHVGKETEAPVLSRLRHRLAIEACVDHLSRFAGVTQPDLAAEDVRLAVRELGRITGRVDVEDLLDVIFRDFCIGK
jgi:tRNA modification GTPase